MLSALAFSVALLGQRGLTDNVPPKIGYVYPPGGRAGTTVEVMIGGYDWTPDMEVFVHDERVKIELTGPLGDFQHTQPPFWFGPKASEQQPPVGREMPARIMLPADMSPGRVRFQVANANGGSPPIDFIVSDAREVVEPENKKGIVELPPLPAVASGRIARITDIDSFHFKTDRAGLTVCRLDDQLGQPFGGVLTIRDEASRVVADAADTVGRGATVRFMARAGERYSANVAHLDHAGDRGNVYRLSVRQEPDVVAVLPAIVSRTTQTEVEIVGWGVKSGTNRLESVTHTVDPAKCALVGDGKYGKPTLLRYEFETPAGQAAALLPTGEQPDVAEPAEENASRRVLTVPARVTGAFDRLDEKLQMPVERYRLSAKKGDVLRIRAVAVEGATPVDPAVAVIAADGAEVVRNDDLLAGVLEAGVDFRCLADGEYDVVVTDASGAPPSRALTYRLLVDDVATAVDFDLKVPDVVNVPIGERADLVVKAAKLGGWLEPITLRLENLPEGVSLPTVEASSAATPVKDAPPAKPGAKTKPKPPARTAPPADVKQPLVAAADSPAGSRLVVLIAATVVESRIVERRYGPVLVTAQMKYRAIVRSATQDGGRVVHRGTTYPAEVFIDRYEGYEGPVTLLTASTQSRQRRGVHGPVVVVPAGVDRAVFPVTMPEWLETSLTTRQNLIAVVETPDPRGRKRFVTGTMDGQIVMSIEGALMKITHEPLERRVAPGGVIEIPVKVSRTPKLQQPARVELMHDDEPNLFTAAQVELPVDQSTAVLKIHLAEAAAARGLRHVVIRATALQDGRWPAVSETRVPVVLVGPNDVATKKFAADGAAP